MKILNWISDKFSASDNNVSKAKDRSSENKDIATISKDGKTEQDAELMNRIKTLRLTAEKLSKGNSSENTSEKSPDTENIAQSEQNPEQTTPQSTDTTNQPEKKLNKKEMAARYTNDILLHLGVSDLPCVLTIMAHVMKLPPALAAVVTVSDSLNLATTVVSAVADAREIVGTLKNPKATKMDKNVDIAHFIACDVVGIATGVLPFFLCMTNPVTLGIFIGGQLLGVAADVAKTIYDIKRKGQQSAH